MRITKVFKKLWLAFIVPLTGITISLAGCSSQNNYEAYLFAYFTGNGPGEESIRFALSPDGYNYRALNDNMPVIDSKKISRSGGVRDPHLLRGEDGKHFYMVATDLYVPDMGWNNYALILMKSEDLIHWESSVINIPETYPEVFGNVDRVWAPQTIYDEQQGKYMVYFSMKEQENHPDIIYYAYANDDFTALETEPKQLFFHPEGKSCIDGDIVKKNGKFHLFFKTEGHGNGIKKAVSDKLTEGYSMQDEYLQQTTDAVEGSGTFKLIGQDKYILMYDVYMKGKYQFTESTDLEHFKVVDEQISMDFHPRHGSVLPITGDEYQLLMDKWGGVEMFGIEKTESPYVKSNNVVFDHEAGEIFLPVKSSTDLSNLDPQFSSAFEARISPEGPQDFSQGPVVYEVEVPQIGSLKYKVTAAIHRNPVLEGYYADPEIIYSQRDEKYYLYPTSDGHHGWSGDYFEAFSSTNLVDWENEGVILDLKTDVPWGPRNAWAPTAIERKVDGNYKYFYYFTAAQKIGVAVSDNPQGPFIDSGKPLVNWKPEGVSGGQEIDPDVFFDPQSQNYFLFWGNGYLAGARLKDDMVSLDRSTVQVMTPADDTFREGVEVFIRNGKYYFLWSENDTRSPDYRVRYAMADSPMGPLTIPEHNLVIARDDSKEIYGTGHNSVIQKAGSDEWFIVYHRFNRPKGIDMGDSAGFHREVCIDRLEFDEQGLIVPVKPTLEGI
ncbi:family 43 glycosylhydrolase [Marinilabilia salmonicolor]|jgi:hypothetical protein|uniref:Glycosyl hydrolase family 43 n=1 Tax=Marinilabilia salmonicolor TaxID=989 RepID=A0A2T0XIU7_9BACT|nr:family 43 glycosylhydrolase [Marinilabilia salmonicolor]PRY98842.1 glycosyl hydrolase family 43 [Marinilabilia salmonicolor]RCW38884.1 glycosyl hydrolase family 43 [Marinilabilia salmonicolor]